MSKLSDYIAPLVNREKNIKPIWKSFKSSWEILLHGLVPHEKAKEASKKILGTHINKDNEKVSELIIELYKESRNRINEIEEKGFKLLTYISAVSAISVYFLSTDINGLYKASVIVSLLFLVLAIVISLRCLGVKGQRALFLDSVFDFNQDDEPKTKSTSDMLANLVDCAVYNHNVADNTADILRASRIMLSLGIFATAIYCIFFLSKAPERNKIYEVKLTDTVALQTIVSGFNDQQDSAAKLSKKIVEIEKKLDSLKLKKEGQRDSDLN
ncbi:hypothetical protein [Sphingobacterium bovisgrunnientis]|uniref:hypothetical protein n=1 Tax=Sphingobacterium bovisgrunnientis TaxID=1874697 RepID=UPI0013593799|nr:hypothetical protein [Sphingobacterium bovisgrunnientis]